MPDPPIACLYTVLRAHRDRRPEVHDFGIGTYIRNLLGSWRGSTRTPSTCCSAGRGRPRAIAASAGARTSGRWSSTAPPYSVSEQIRIPIALRRERVDLFHAPHYVLPPLIHCRSVVTIHDCIHLMFPQYLPNRLALRLRARRRCGRPRTGPTAS